MTELTSPDNIVKWTNADSGSLIQASQTQGDSVQAALSKRERYEFVWANDAERTAQTGMAEGSRGYQIDSRTDYLYRTSSWRVFNTLNKAFSPTLNNITLGTSSHIEAWYSISAGWANLLIKISLGGGGTIGTGAGVLVPTSVAPAAESYIGDLGDFWVPATQVGTALYYDQSALTKYVGVVELCDRDGVTTFDDGILMLRYVTTSLTQTSISSTLPFTWTSDDDLILNVAYPTTLLD